MRSSSFGARFADALRPTRCAAAIATFALLAGGAASAQSPEAKPPAPAANAPEGAKKADDKAKDKLDKAADKLDKAADKLDKAKDKAAEKLDDAERAAKRAERELRAKAEREVLRGEVKSALKGGPMTDSMRQELKRHARRVARIERVALVARAQKDGDSADRANKLLEKENARHARWIQNFDPKADQKVGAR